MGRIKALLVFLFVMGLVYVCYIVGPPYFNNYQFEDDLRQQVRYMQNANQPDDEIKAAVVKKALDSDVTITPEQIHITRINKTITVSVDYAVHVDIPGYPTDLEFHPTATNTLAM
ncbi:MAG TPA: hypothetical protein VGL89_06380 [Candidatus Koribacter sp.]|jgi:hypothetical protein